MTATVTIFLSGLAIGLSLAAIALNVVNAIRMRRTKELLSENFRKAMRP